MKNHNWEVCNNFLILKKKILKRYFNKNSRIRSSSRNRVRRRPPHNLLPVSQALDKHPELLDWTTGEISLLATTSYSMGRCFYRLV